MIWAIFGKAVEVIAMVNDVGLSYFGPHERLPVGKTKLYDDFWKVIRESGIDRRRQRSMLGLLPRPFSINASKTLKSRKK